VHIKLKADEVTIFICGGIRTGEAATMSDYRAYILGKGGHRFTKVAGFLSDHPDDAAAMKAAKRLDHEYEVELWERGRLVAQFGPRRRTATTLRNFTAEYIRRTAERESQGHGWRAWPRSKGTS
jgi:hypothetical protein